MECGASEHMLKYICFFENIHEADRITIKTAGESTSTTNKKLNVLVQLLD